LIDECVAEAMMLMIAIVLSKKGFAYEPFQQSACLCWRVRWIDAQFQLLGVDSQFYSIS